MFLDKLLMFSEAQAITAAAKSTNSLDMGYARNLGVGEELYIFACVTTAFTDSGSDSTLVVSLEGDTTSTFTPDGTQVLFTFGALSPRGTIKYARLNPDTVDFRYLQLSYDPAGGNLTTGAITAGIVTGIQLAKMFPKGYTIN